MPFISDTKDWLDIIQTLGVPVSALAYTMWYNWKSKREKEYDLLISSYAETRK